MGRNVYRGKSKDNPRRMDILDMIMDMKGTMGMRDTRDTRGMRGMNTVIICHKAKVRKSKGRNSTMNSRGSQIEF